MAKLNKVTVQEVKDTVVVQGGATWGGVYEEAAKHKADVVRGDVCSVGVGGSLTGGGYSKLIGQHGPRSDNIVEATFALADGWIIKAGHTEEPELFWAFQGGQGQFGLALLSSQEQYLWLSRPCSRSLSRRWDPLHVEFSRAHPHFYPGLVVIPYIPGPPSRGEAVLKLFRSLNPIVEFLNDASVGLDKGLFAQMWGAFVKFTAEHPEAKENIFMWQWQPVGVVKDHKSDQTAFSKRGSLSRVLVHGRHRVPEFDQVNIAWVRETVGMIRDKHPKGGAITNFACGDESATAMYGPENAHKAKYDRAGF
ncbi:hypothetical protein EW146_g4234 [Bondarzewia mesenterica]|uniref:FAD-binding PCMH-type domain-containing protein n=1 Tax=Bondarzewia mesenterica TaxID=1095465 RepID=A0A4S4LW87_9AGAM|nr:hypothetical protein EW146_g4234 [Bondarzewia mesenterica]